MRRLWLRATLFAAALLALGSGWSTSSAYAGAPPPASNKSPLPASASAAPNPPAPGADGIDDAEFAIPTRKDRIGRILAPVYVNGKGPFRFMVDTGANSSAIGPALASALGISPVVDGPRARVHGVTGAIDAPTVRIQSLRADKIEHKEFDAPVLAAGALSGADGVFGVDALEGRRLLVDFRADRIEIGPADRARPLTGAVRIKGKLRFGQLLMTRARVGDVSVAAVIDTGAERSIGNRALLDALRGGRSGVREIGDITFDGATGQVRTGRLIFLPQLSIGGLDIVNLPAIVSDAYVFDLWDLAQEPALLIGMDVLGQARAMAIDYKRAELQLVLPISPAATMVTRFSR